MARKIILKDNGLNESSNTPSGYKYLGYNNETISQKSGATVSSIAQSSTNDGVVTIGSSTYYEMILLVASQGVGNAPSYNIIKSNMPFNIVDIDYMGSGQYLINIDESLESGNVNSVFGLGFTYELICKEAFYILYSNINDENFYITQEIYSNLSSILLQANNLTGNSSERDELLSNHYLTFILKVSQV